MGKTANEVIQTSDNLLKSALSKLQGTCEHDQKEGKIIDVSECYENVSLLSKWYKEGITLGSIVYNKLIDLFSGVDSESTQKLCDEKDGRRIIEILAECANLLDKVAVSKLGLIVFRAEKFDRDIFSLEFVIDRKLETIDLNEYSLYSNTKNSIVYKKNRTEWMLNILTNELSNVLDGGYITKDYGINYSVYDSLKFKDCNLNNGINLKGECNYILFQAYAA